MTPLGCDVSSGIELLRAAVPQATGAVGGWADDRLPVGTNREPSACPPAASGEPELSARLAGCLEYMSAHFQRPLRVSTLSSMAGLSESRFYELFRTATGYTPIHWLIRTRMRRAARLLECTRLPVKAIADQVGYEDPFYFSRMFKSVQGISPSGYRAQKQEHPPQLIVARDVSDGLNIVR
jgi:AraC-like DNA-binding protein